jgi:hypothetical protein
MAARAEDLFRCSARSATTMRPANIISRHRHACRAEGEKSVVIEAQPWEMAGVNSRAELAWSRPNGSAAAA